MMFGEKKFFIFHLFAVLSGFTTIFVIIFAHYNPESYSLFGPGMLAQARGQDLVTLFLVIPVMKLALTGSVNRSPLASILVAGCLGYLLYTYAIFAYSGYSRLLLFYILIVFFGLYGLADFFRGFDSLLIPELFPGNRINTLAALYNMAIGTLVAIMWLGFLVPTALTGNIPEEVSLNDNNSTVYVNDLALLLPVIVLSGYFTLKRNRTAMLVLAVTLVIEDAIGGAILGMIFMMRREGLPMNSAMTLLFVAVTLLSLIVSALFLTQPLRRMPVGKDDG